MAFASAWLVKTAQFGPVNSHWTYDTADAAATVDDSGYFTGVAVGMLKVGDLIFRRTWGSAPPTMTTLSTFGWHAVVSNDGTTVDTTDTTAGTTTNTN